MKSIITPIIFYFSVLLVNAQSTFVKEIDLKNHSHDNVFGLALINDELLLLSKSCSGNCISIAKLKDSETVTFYQEVDLSISDDPFLIDKDTLIIFGDNSTTDIYSKIIYKQTLSGEFIYQKSWTDPQNNAIGIDHEGSIQLNDNYISIGSFLDREKYEKGEYKTKGYVAFLNRDGSMDTFMVFDDFQFVRFRDADIASDGVLTLRADIIDSSLPDGYQDCIWIIKLDENKNIIWEWKSGGQLSTPDPGHIKCINEVDILLQNYQKRRGSGFAQTVELLNHQKEIVWKQFKPSSLNNRYIAKIDQFKENIQIIGRLTEQNIFPTFYNSAISSVDGKLKWDRRYINYHNKDKEIQITHQSSGLINNFLNLQSNKNILIGSKSFNYLSGDSIIKNDINLILIQTDSFGCVNLDKCNDYYAWGDVPDSLFQYDQIDMKQKEWYYSTTNNKGITETKHLTFGQDSILFDRLWGDRQYKEVLVSDAHKENTILDTLFVRWENTGKLYFIDKWQPKDGVVSPADSILYDYTLKVGDKFLLPHGYGYSTVIKVDSIDLLDGFKRKRITLNHNNTINQNKYGDLVWIEGIGAENGLFYFNDWVTGNHTIIDCYLDRNMKRWGNDFNCKPVVIVKDTSEFKIGDTWTYSDWIDGACEDRPIYQYSIVSDTLIGEKVYSVLAVKADNKLILESKVLLFKKENKIHFFENGNDYLLYDFTVKVGDTINFYLPSNVRYYTPSSHNNTGLPKSEQLIITNIDSVKTSEGAWIKKYATDVPTPYPYDDCNTLQYIFEGVGAKYGIFGFGCFVITTGCYGSLRCFSSDDVNLNLTNEECLPTNFSIDTSLYKIGDRWLFTPHSLTCTEVIASVDVVRDTLIGNRICNIIGLSENGNYVKESEVILFYHDSIVMFYEDGKFKIIYDYHSKYIGDTVEFYFPKNSLLYDLSSTGGTFKPNNNSYRYKVTGKSNIIDDSGNVHTKYEVNLIYSEPCFELGREIIEGIGSTTGLFGRGCLQLPSGCSEYFRCFKGKQFNYNALNKDCELTATNEFEKQSFSMVPNPSNDKISIIGDLKFDKINIYSLLGAKLISESNDSIIDISGLSNGIYIVEIALKGKSLGKKKFIKSE